MKNPYNPEHRGVRIGGSDIPTILGINKWKSRLGLWQELTDRKNGIFDRTEETNQNIWGKHVEEAIREVTIRDMNNEPELQKYSGYNLCKPQPYEDEHFLSSPDGVFRSSLQDKTSGLWEAKTCMSSTDAETWRNGQCPVYAHTQCVWNMGHNELEWGIASCSLYGSAELFHVELEHDPDLFDKLKNLAYEFLLMVKTGKRPSADHNDSRLVLEIVKTVQGKKVNIKDPNLSKLAEEWVLLQEKESKLNAQVKKMKERRDTIKNELILVSDGASELYFENNLIANVGLVEKKQFVTKASRYLTFKVQKPE